MGAAPPAVAIFAKFRSQSPATGATRADGVVGRRATAVSDHRPRKRGTGSRPRTEGTPLRRRAMAATGVAVRGVAGAPTAAMAVDLGGDGAGRRAPSALPVSLRTATALIAVEDGAKVGAPRYPPVVAGPVGNISEMREAPAARQGRTTTPWRRSWP